MNFPLSVPKHFRIIAHRGASAYAPENTVAAFHLAQEMGCLEVELDVQLCSDGIPVLCHDLSLEKYGYGNRRVEEMTSQEFLQLDMGSWFSPHLFSGTPGLTLVQLFATFHSSFLYHVELKGEAEELPSSVLECVQQEGLIDKVIFTSFSFHHLKKLRTLSQACRLAWLVQELNDEALQGAKELELYQLCPNAETVSEFEVEKAHDVCKEVRVWGVGGAPVHLRELVQRVVALGCDGMTISRPDWASHESKPYAFSSPVQ